MFDKFYESIVTYFKALFAAGTSVAVIKIVGALLVLAFVLYLLFAKKDHRSPFWGMIVLVTSVLIFGGFIVVGEMIGRSLGIEDWGAMVGVGVFVFLGGIYKFLITPKEQRRKRM